MSNLPNIIQRRELDPLLHKADKIAKHYEKIANCSVCVLRPEYFTNPKDIDCICKHCNKETDNNGNKKCVLMHLEAIKKAKNTGGFCIYSCPKSFIFWLSPFYSGERYAGALLSGGMQKSTRSLKKIEALANIMLICADHISGDSFVQKNITAFLENANYPLKNDYEDVDFLTLDMERMLIANLRRGDISEARKLLLKLLNTRYNEVKENLPVFRLKALELLVVLSRATSNPDDINDNTVLEENSRYQKKINESTSFREIESILEEITERMSGKIFSFHGVKHFSALRKAERYIWEHYTGKISLHEIAKASGLSAPYFSTIFKEEMGENLSDYLNRLRAEKAASLLITTNTSIGEIAKTCGFEDQSWFSKIFKKYTGFTPGKYRDQGSVFGLSA